MNHMAETGIKGGDLYFNNKGNWQYLNTGRPTGIENESKLITDMANEMREFKMYLPLYDGIESIEIRIDSNSVIKRPLKKTPRSIIFTEPVSLKADVHPALEWRILILFPEN